MLERAGLAWPGSGILEDLTQLDPATFGIVDLVVIALAVMFAIVGWRRGFVQGLASFAGFVIGAMVGSYLGPQLVDRLGLINPWRITVVIAAVVFMALVGQLVLGRVGAAVASMLDWHPVRLLDSVLGAALNVVALGVLLWITASAVTAAPSGPLGDAIARSPIMSSLDRWVPSPARTVVRDLRALLDDSGLPRIFEGYAGIKPPQVPPPDSALAKQPEVRQALGSVVKVIGSSSSCNRAFTGSGFVSSTGHVVTNAHVVAGTDSLRVALSNGTSYIASVVRFDPKVDFAVLYVPGLSAAPLRPGPPAERGDGAVVVGYPGGGPLTVTPARVRGVLPPETAVGTDIYGKTKVAREVYVLRAAVRPGNSGGPLLNQSGRVTGLVFAQGHNEKNVGYAVSWRQISKAVIASAASTSAVPNGTCSAG